MTSAEIHLRAANEIFQRVLVLLREAQSKKLAYTPEEAAEALSISKESVLQLIRQGRLRAWHMGRVQRIPKEDLLALLQVDLPSIWPTNQPFPENREGYERPKGA